LAALVGDLLRSPADAARAFAFLELICLAILLAGCGGGLRVDASTGPNPGGGFYGAPSINIGRINP
jgi:hypothetical protein